MNTCYAHSAADLLRYQELKMGKPDSQINPSWIAFVHKYNAPFYHWDKDSLDFSVLSWSLKSLRDEGVCNNAAFSKALADLKNGNDLTDTEILGFYEQLWDAYRALDGDDEKAFEAAYSTVTSSEDFVGKIKYPLINSFKFIVQIDTNSKLEALNRHISKYCNDSSIYKYNVPEYGGSFLNSASNDSIHEVIDGIIESDRMVGVGYCFKLFMNGPRYRALGSNLRLFKMILNDDKCWAHYSSVVGRRKSLKTDSCEYLVRNTMGTEFWTDHFECFCEEKSTGLKRDCRSSEKNPDLKVLGCWVDADDLAANIFDYTYFK